MVGLLDDAINRSGARGIPKRTTMPKSGKLPVSPVPRQNMPASLAPVRAKPMQGKPRPNTTLPSVRGNPFMPQPARRK